MFASMAAGKLTHSVGGARRVGRTRRAVQRQLSVGRERQLLLVDGRKLLGHGSWDTISIRISTTDRRSTTTPVPVPVSKQPHPQNVPLRTRAGVAKRPRLALCVRLLRRVCRLAPKAERARAAPPGG